MTGTEQTILVADDEPDIRASWLRLTRGGYRVIEAGDGEEAFQLAAGHAPGMAVLDVSMPRLNGFELTERLRRTPALQRLPVLLISARVQDGDIARGLAVGADGYLTKPFNPDELLSRVRDLLAGPRPA